MENQVRTAINDLGDIFNLLKWEINKGEHVTQAINEQFAQRLSEDACKSVPATAHNLDRIAAFADVLDDILRRMGDMLASYDTDSIIDHLRTGARPQGE